MFVLHKLEKIFFSKGSYVYKIFIYENLILTLIKN